ncbi:ABC transporter substrate-binding protein [Castellaniella sp.]|uniref:ABC transporter substrate-binding protein n=1 Tax=Castellaniella sp. TaxID=1955812 RepID=UPI003C7459D3
MKYTYRSLAVAAVMALWSTAGWSAQAQEIKVGSVISLTGNNARGGSGMHEGMEVAVSVFNQSQSKYSIKLLTIDDESDPAKAISGVAQLSSQHVVAITGGATSDLVAPAAAAANKVGLVYITSGGTSKEFVTQGYRKFFRINNTDGYVKAMTGFFKSLGAKNLSVVYSTQKSTFELSRLVKEIMEAHGAKVNLHAFDPGLRDFKQVVNKVKLFDKPDVINVLGYENDYVGFLRAARILKPDVKAIVGVWQIANAKMSKEFPDLVEHVSGTEMLPYPVEFKDAEGQRFEKAFKQQFKRSPDYLNEYGYVQSTLLFEAIARAADKGALDTPDGLADEMHKTDRQTLIGHIVFQDNGDNPNFMPNIGQHQDGKVVLVWPPEAASGTLMLPGVPW